ncbi:MAG: imidazolonepropionase [Flavobacteriaceae bacterium]|mgnify:CR=1 FL=1|nr:imidazolonepropionase [Flavobacteriaceae bacterium]
MKILFKNIKGLLQTLRAGKNYLKGLEMKKLSQINNAYLLINNGIISDFGEMKSCPEIEVNKIIDSKGKFILPAWCDSHTHIVYSGSREEEFVDRIAGANYEEIAKNGGGILNSAKKLKKTSFGQLYNQSAKRLEEVIKLGTGAIEIKSGYGLELSAEIKMLKVINKLKKNYDASIQSTFLAAHAIPEEYKNKREEYITQIINEWIPLVSEKKLAKYIDVFCEKEYFGIEETRLIIKAGKKHGLIPKIHVNQFNSIGGVPLCTKLGSLTIDHLEVLNEKDLNALKNSDTIAVALPNCSFFLKIPYTPARKIIDNNIPLVLASDYNPGSAPSGNMNFVISLACTKMGMSPEEAINAATINGAHAMGLSKKLGSITKGKKANLIITKSLPSYSMIPYAFGSNLIEDVYIKGKSINNL